MGVLEGPSPEPSRSKENKISLAAKKLMVGRKGWGGLRSGEQTKILDIPGGESKRDLVWPDRLCDKPKGMPGTAHPILSCTNEGKKVGEAE